MAHPPEIITVKRRRDEEPIDALYIQPKRYRASALWKRVDQEKPTIAPAIFGDDAASESRTLQSSVPLVTQYETQKPEFNNETNTIVPSSDEAHSTLEEKKKYDSDLNPAVTQPHTSTRFGHGRVQRREPRRFHLANAAQVANKPVPYGSSKQKTRQRDVLAVFVEKLERQHGTVEAAQVVQMLSSGVRRNADFLGRHIESAPPRKRPNVNTIEAARKQASHTRAVEKVGNHYIGARKKVPNEWDRDSEELAARLQTVAFEEIASQAKETSPSTRRLALKYQPKPPGTRKQGISSPRDDAKDISSREDSDNTVEDVDYVLDTYVKAASSNLEDRALGDLVDPLRGDGMENVGILVIDEEEEVSWEAFGEVEGSDVDWDSEEDDENAENYRGNDYPEDEVNSESENDRWARSSNGDDDFEDDDSS